MSRSETRWDFSILHLVPVIVVTVVAMAVLIVAPGAQVVGTVCGLPLALLLPGYALMLALFPNWSLKGAEKALVCLGLSLAVVALGGLALNLTPWGLQARSWAIFLGLFTLGASAVAFVRQRGQPTTYPRQWRIGMHGRQIALLGLTIVILAGAFTVAYVGVTQERTPGFTQLWILQAAAPPQQRAIRVGVKNMEVTTLTYQARIVVNGKVVATSSPFKLAPDQTWSTTITLPPGVAATAPVVVALYRTDAPHTIYREVELWPSKR